MTIPWLPQVLRGAGLTVVEQHVMGRTGKFDPKGVLIHHTATVASAAIPRPSLDLVKRGRLTPGPSYLPGPLCQVLVGYDGRCDVITTGRANHAGQAKASGPMPAGDGNALYVGLELDYSGHQQPSTAQVITAVKASRAICDRLRAPHTHVRGHRETSVTGKWDPGNIDMDRFRADVAATTAPQEDDMLVIATARDPKTGGIWKGDFVTRTVFQDPAEINAWRARINEVNTKAGKTVILVQEFGDVTDLDVIGSVSTVDARAVAAEVVSRISLPAGNAEQIGEVLAQVLGRTKFQA